MSGDTSATAVLSATAPTINVISDVIYYVGDEIRLRETMMVDTVAPIMGTILMIVGIAGFITGLVMLYRRARS